MQCVPYILLGMSPFWGRMDLMKYQYLASSLEEGDIGFSCGRRTCNTARSLGTFLIDIGPLPEPINN